MPNPVKGIMHGKIIELEQSLPFSEGAVVLVSVEVIQISYDERRRRIFDLSGAWKEDPSITEIFEDIAKERRSHKGLEVQIC